MTDEKDKSDEIEDDVLGSDSDVQPIDTPHVNEWLKADDNGFRPTPQQEKFR